MIYVVTGWPRSGTSAMMRLLASTGLQPQYSPARERAMQRRRAGAEYFELRFEEVRDPQWMLRNLGDCVAVKVLTPYLRSLPPRPMKIIWMHRDPSEIMRSLQSMYPETDFAKVYPQWPEGYHETTRVMRELMEDRRSVLSITDVHQSDLLRDPQAVLRTLPELRKAS